jgi:hypothetical protein
LEAQPWLAGLTLDDNQLRLAVYDTVVARQGVAAEVWLDGECLTGPEIPLQDDGQSHQVTVLLGPK